MDHLEEIEKLEYQKKLESALAQDEIELFRNEFFQAHPYDQAQFFLKQPEEIRERIYTYLSPEEMAEIFENFETDEQEMILNEMEPAFTAKMLSDMYVDDAVDVLNELDKEQIASYLALMDREAVKEIKQLLHYEEKTAGSIMTTEYVVIHSSNTVREAMQILKKEAPEAETIYYIFVIDRQKRLVGVVSLRDLIIAEDGELIQDVMNERVVSVSAGKDQEEVARMMKDYDFLALPVVDFKNHLLGIITVDDIMDVMDEEANEDYSRLAGVSDMDTADRDPMIAAKKRLPWLIILLFLGLITANLIGMFEATLDKVAILATFIPLIAGMAGNSGTQALAVAVRGIATGDFEEESRWRLIRREAGTGVITGTISGIVVAIIVYFWHHQLFLGLLVGFSIQITLVVATLAGALVPLLMHRLNVDPAVASGPFITTLNDIISLLIYFGMATVFMQYLL
ncbi:magnesium transporter [Bacillus marinisedimentorum]|uniref:magnesium transporter n=1 Tax=Bacillus marinisedimentorum TaxID=1821260 RepID=UPI0008730E62|nr:magnesium transporter [Bacillus marinisedimentorum]